MSPTSAALPSRSRRWRNSTLAKQADHRCAQLRSPAFVKVAAIGGEQETAFEQSFASLAFTYLSDAAPKLLDHMVGFQLVDRNNDNTKAVGVFGFQLGDTWAYAPMFFLNGDLKGHELLYLKDQDMFVPLKESWVNYVLAKRPRVLGSSVPNQSRQIGAQQPDLRSMLTPNMFGKRGSHGPTVYPSVPVGGWLPPTSGFKAVYGAFSAGGLDDASYRVLRKHANFSPGSLLHDFVRVSPAWCKLAMDVCDAYPRVGAALEKFHGEDFFKQALLDIQSRLSTQKSALLADELDDAVFKYHFDGQGRRPAKRKGLTSTKIAAGPPVSIRVRQDTLTTENGPGLKDLSDEEAAAVARNGYLVKDQRTGEEVSKSYNVQVEQALSNPDDSGLFEVLEKPAKFVKTLIISHPHSTDGRQDFCTAVRLEPKSWLNASPSSLFAKPHTGTREEFDEWYDGLSDSDSLETDGTYLIVSKSGQGTVPFSVREKLDDGRYRISPDDYSDRRRPSYLPTLDRPRSYNSDEDFCSGPSLLYLTDREGTTFRSSQNILQVPKEHKILKLKSPPKPDDDGCCSTPTQSESTAFDPGNLLDLQMEILQKTASLKLYADGHEVSINSGDRTSKLAALCSLIVEHGFRQKEAEDLLKQAEVAHARLGGGSRFRVVYGPAYPRQKAAFDPFLAGQGPSAPPIQDPEFGYSGDFGNVMTQEPDAYSEEVPDMSSYNTDPNVYNPLPEYMPDPYGMSGGGMDQGGGGGGGGGMGGDMAQAQQAGETGQKEVFDTAMISGLLKSVRKDSMISKYIPDLLKAMDRCGRILALLYWRNEEFADRYGKSDLPELEDSLRNTFDSIGDLALFVKSRDVAPLAGGVESDVDVDDATGD